MVDDFDIIFVGAGIAGTACALRCARAGLSVLLLERGERPGSKNLSGGRLYAHALAELLPHFQRTAPLERRITQKTSRYSRMTARQPTPACVRTGRHGACCAPASIPGLSPRRKPKVFSLSAA